MGQDDPLEEEMALHSSILAWDIPWTEEPRGLQPMRLESQTGVSNLTSNWRCYQRYETWCMSKFHTLHLQTVHIYQNQNAYISGLPWWLRQQRGNAGSAGDPGSIPRSGRSPQGGNGNPLQYSCLKNPMGGGAWQARSKGSWSQIRLSNWTHTHTSVICCIFIEV